MIYKFRILSGEVDDFIREIEIKKSQTFFDLHTAIQESVHFDKSQMASFFLSDDSWERGREITLLEMTEDDSIDLVVMDVALLSEFVNTQKQKIIYLFDFFSERVFFIELIGGLKEDPSKKYPVCTKSEGKSPPQIVIESVDDSYEEPDNDYDFPEDLNFENIEDYDDMI